MRGRTESHSHPHMMMSSPLSPRLFPRVTLCDSCPTQHHNTTTRHLSIHTSTTPAPSHPLRLNRYVLLFSFFPLSHPKLPTTRRNEKNTEARALLAPLTGAHLLPSLILESRESPSRMNGVCRSKECGMWAIWSSNEGLLDLI